MTAIPQNVGVLGGGRMGAGIAHAFLINGATVVVVERDYDAAAGARARVADAVAKEILLAGRVLKAEEALAVNLVTELHEAAELMGAAHRLADRIARQDPLAVRITKSVFHAPAEAHPLIDQLAQGILFESQAKFDRMQAFLDKKASGTKAPGKTSEADSTDRTKP
jgi:enoyl-CoA hydratase